MASSNRSRLVLKSCARMSPRQQSQLLGQFWSLQLGSRSGRRRYASLEFERERRPRGQRYRREDDTEKIPIPPELRVAKHARAVPASPSYFSRQSQFHDSYIKLMKLLRENSALPTLKTTQAERVAWMSLRDYKQTVGEAVKAREYANCLTMVRRLHLIHPALKKPELKQALSQFMKDHQTFNNVVAPRPVDNFGRGLGVGRRKTSVARAWVVEGTGEVLVNGKSLAGMFGRVHDRESAVWALQATARIDKYNVWALVEGGGTTGQAEALTLAVAKALLSHEPALKPTLRRAGCVTRDMRRVERKKHGRVKARKMPTWVKR